MQNNIEADVLMCEFMGYEKIITGDGYYVPFGSYVAEPDKVRKPSPFMDWLFYVITLKWINQGGVD